MWASRLFCPCILLPFHPLTLCIITTHSPPPPPPPLPPHSKVNDNFCDCPDGSDEPGTSACAPMGRFYCLNEGHKGASIPSSKVNDGVCELACCDGSDEAPGVCPNQCAALAAVRNEERAARRKLIEGGIAKKKEYIKDGAAKMESRFKELASIQAQKIALGGQITKARTRKEVEESREMLEKDKAVQQAAAKLSRELGVDKKEKEKLVELYHQLKGRSGKALKVVLADIKAKAEIEELEEDDEEEDEEEGEGESKWGEMTEEKRQKDADLLKERMMNRKKEKWRGKGKEGTFFKKQLGPVPADEDEEEEEDEGEEEDELFDDYDKEEEEEEDASDLTFAAGKEKKEKKETKIQEELNPILKDMLREAEEGVNEPLPSAEAAREALTAVEKEERELGERFREIEAEGEEDYGGGFEFYLLKGKCFSKTVNKYRYEMCPYKEAQQLEGSASSGTRLGKWEGMERVNGSVKTSGGGEIAYKFLFRHGAKCWNGPERLLTVLVGCGWEDEVVSVDESSMCEYEMEFRTPAACSSVLLEEEEGEEGEGRGGGWHGEL